MELNDEMAQAYEAFSADMARAAPAAAVSTGAECAELSVLQPSDVVTSCPTCGHYSSMCRAGLPCQLCQLQAQINDLRGE